MAGGGKTLYIKPDTKCPHCKGQSNPAHSVNGREACKAKQAKGSGAAKASKK